MKLTLRAAARLQDEINQVISTLTSKLSRQGIVNISILDTQNLPSYIIAGGNVALRETKNRILALVQALYEIRRLVGKANSEYGISDALTELSLVNRLIELNTLVSSFEVAQNDSIVEGRIKQAREPNPVNRHPIETITAYVNSVELKEEAENEVSKLKRVRRSISDKILGLNTGTTIDISQSAVETLTAEGLV